MADIIKKIREKYGDKIEIFEKTSKRIYVFVNKEHIKEIVNFLCNDIGGRFSTASGVDVPGYMEILYHVAFDAHNAFVTVKTQIDKPALEIDSITGVIPAAMWIEREMNELLGIKFLGHPDLRRLLLADDWPEGIHPLRKNYPQVRRE